jgi:hypothetical protein
MAGMQRGMMELELWLAVGKPDVRVRLGAATGTGAVCKDGLRLRRRLRRRRRRLRGALARAHRLVWIRICGCGGGVRSCAEHSNGRARAMHVTTRV